MLPTNMLVGVYLIAISLCTFFEMTNSRTSTMWKLNTETGKIQTLTAEEDHIKNYASLDEDMLYNFNAMADVYTRDETFFTIVSSTRIDSHSSSGGGWLRQSAENTLESLLQAKKLKTEREISSAKNKKSTTTTTTTTTATTTTTTINGENNHNNKIALRNSTHSVDNLDCGQPVNYTNYDYIINLGAQYKHKQTPAMPEPDVNILVFL